MNNIFIGVDDYSRRDRDDSQASYAELEVVRP
jgi:hypothetical protein